MKFLALCLALLIALTISAIASEPGSVITTKPSTEPQFVEIMSACYNKDEKTIIIRGLHHKIIARYLLRSERFVETPPDTVYLYGGEYELVKNTNITSWAKGYFSTGTYKIVTGTVLWESPTINHPRLVIGNIDNDTKGVLGTDKLYSRPE